MRLLILSTVVACGPKPPSPDPAAEALPSAPPFPPAAACDLTGAWQVELPAGATAPFSSQVTFSNGPAGLCVQHPGGAVNAQLDAILTDGVLRVQWTTQAMVDALAATQTGPSVPVPVRGAPAPEPPPTCATALPPGGMSDGVLDFLRDPWGYTCAVDPACGALECGFFRSADQRTATFRMVR